MLKLRLQYFGHLMQTAGSLEKTLMLGKTEGKRKRLRWLNGLTSSMDMNLGKLQKIVRDREAGRAAVHGIAKSRTWLKDGTTTACGIDVNSSLSIWCNSPVKLFGPGNLFCGCSLNYKFNFLTWRCSNHLFHIERVVVQFSSVAQSCPNLCDPRDCSIPGLPVHHLLLEFTQTHDHWVSDAIQPSHPLSSPFPPAFNQSLCHWISSSHHVAKVLEFQPQHQSFQWTPRTGLL